MKVISINSSLIPLIFFLPIFSKLKEKVEYTFIWLALIGMHHLIFFPIGAEHLILSYK